MPELRTKGPSNIDSNYYHQRVYNLLELRKFRQAIREARNALKQDPEDAEAHRLLAWLLWEQRKLKAAETSARAALRLAPYDANTHSTLAIILADLQKQQEAQKLHEQAIALEPNVAIFHVRYGDFWLRVRYARSFLFSTNAWKKALQQADIALQLDPRSVPAHRLRANIFRVKRRFAEAEASAREALNIAPNEAGTHEALGDIYSAREKGRQALAYYREAIRLDPSSEIIEQKLLWAAKTSIPIFGVFFRKRQGAWTVIVDKKRRTYFKIYMTLFTILNNIICVWFVFSSNQVLPSVFISLWWGLCSLIFFLGLMADPLIKKAVVEGWIK